MIICSACLLGIATRYDGKSKPSKNILKLAKKEVLIPVCPEQLGGLKIPRNPSEIKGNKVIMFPDVDVTKNFKMGARKVLEIAKAFKIKKAILKQRSGSCGSGQVYDGTFKRRIIKKDGITTALLKKNGIKVISEEEL